MSRPGWRSRAAAWGRRRLWRGAFGLVGHGVAVSGTAPNGGCVVVANHSSHADVAALLAALPASAAAVAAAAADHWFGSRARAAVCRTLSGGRPVRRGGGGWEDLRALVPLLDAGRTVIVFPEGTRSRSGDLGDFHRGAFALAAEAGVPVVPAALLGTAEVLPLNGPLRCAPTEVRFGAPLTAEDPQLAREQARRVVQELLAGGPARPSQARSHRALAALAGAPAGLVLAFCWGAAEATSWPLLAELLLMVLVPAAPRRWWPLALALAAGSVTGVLGCALAARHGILLPAPLTTARMHATAAAQLAQDGPGALWAQLRNGIPVKVYAREAGSAGIPLPALAVTAAAARTLRIGVLAAVIAAIGRVGQRPLRTGYGLYLPLLVTGFGLALAQVVATWR